MKIKRRHNETMLWIDSIKTLVRFNKDGYATVTDEAVAKEMYKLGYTKDSDEKTEEPKLKQLKPLKTSKKAVEEEAVDYKV